MDVVRPAVKTVETAHILFVLAPVPAARELENASPVAPHSNQTSVGGGESVPITIMPEFRNLTAGQVMHRDPICSRPDEPLSDLARRLIEAGISGVPVVDDDRLVGIVSRSDVLRVRVLHETLDDQVQSRLQPADISPEDFSQNLQSAFRGFSDQLSELKVTDVMRSDVVTCNPETPIAQVAQQMIDGRIHRVVVVDKDRPVGLISSLDLVALVAGDGPSTSA